MSAWLQTHLRLPPAEASEAAASVIAIVDGLLLLRLAGRLDMAQEVSAAIAGWSSV